MSYDESLGFNNNDIEIIEAKVKIAGAYHGGTFQNSFMRARAIDLLGLKQPNSSNMYVGEAEVYAIPLGSYKFGTDSVPLSKVNGIQLEFIARCLGDADFVGKPLPSELHITAVGTNVLTYTGGSCNIHF